MRPAERLVSIFIAALIALRVCEGWLQLESWPLSYAPMFSTRVPRDVLPIRVALQRRRGDAWEPMAPLDFGLTPVELERRLLATGALAARCGELGRLYNRRAGQARLAALRAVVVEVRRPGVDRAPRTQIVDCPLGGD